jgi:chromate transporter
MNRNKNIYWILFSSTFYISAVTFGGGYIIVPLMRKKFVDNLKWIEEEEMLNLTAIAQSSPGAIAVNASILIGYKMAGFLGVFFTLLGTVLPPFTIITIISFFYTAFESNKIVQILLNGMQAGIAAVILEVVLGMGYHVFKEKNILSILIMISAFFASFFFHINVIYIIVICGFLGAILTIHKEKKESHK